MQDDINRQNAAYCTGLLVQASPEQAGPFLPQVLAALHTLFSADEAAGARDNAVGAVGRIMLAVPQALPLGQVLPVYLGGLPLQVRAAGLCVMQYYHACAHHYAECAPSVTMQQFWEGCC